MFERLRSWMRTKTNEAYRVILEYTLKQAQWSRTDYETMSREGFQSNVYVYACIKQIAMACAGIPWILYNSDNMQKGEEIDKHPLLDLLQRPNPMQGHSRFMENVVAYLLLDGNSFISAVGPDNGPPIELWTLRPDRVGILPGDSIDPILGYVYSITHNETGTLTYRYRYDEILHLPLFNPLDDWRGMSPLQVAAKSVDQNNMSREWNVSLLQNGARPWGALSTEAKLDEPTRKRLEKKLEEKYSGYAAGGRPMVLEGGLKWEEMGLSPVDMAWLEGTQLSAREIAIAFNVPPELIGDSSNKTYSNYKEARLALYIENVLPLMSWIRDEFNRWLVPRFGKNLYLDYDKDEIEALQEEREKVWARIKDAHFLTQNEKRLALGYEARPDCDVILVPYSMIPIDKAGTVQMPSSVPIPRGNEDDKGKGGE